MMVISHVGPTRQQQCLVITTCAGRFFRLS